MNANFLAWALATPWAMHPATMAAYASVLVARELRKAGLPTNDAVSTVAAATRGAGGRRGAIAVIPVHGTIVQRASQIDPCDGGTSTAAISAALRDANADDTIAQILLDVDSPGGSVYGVQELADEIRASKKPVVALANSLAASAGYWVASSASEVYVTPGGEVGSIGVWTAHQDVSAALELQGVKIELISAGKHKVDGHPYGPLSDDARDHMQARVSDYYAAFTNAVAKGRKVPVAQVRDSMGQGRVLGASEALAQNMVDGIKTFDDVVRHMSRAFPHAPGSRRALTNARIELAAMG